MANTFGSRLKRAWNIFMNKDPTPYITGMETSYYRPDRRRAPVRNERTIVNAIINRIAIDAASVRLEHIKMDENRRYLSTIQSGLNNCLTIEANIDQTGRAFVQDMVQSMLDEGSIAVVPRDVTIPADTNYRPEDIALYDIRSLRVCKIVGWMPKHVRVEIYNDDTGKKQEVVLPKAGVAIIENPFFSVMNEPSSTLQRLIRKLALLDVIDEQSGSGKLDLILQLPYVIRTDLRRKQAEDRRKEIERQLSDSKYGIAYTDGTERITQLNRSVENNLMKQIEYLTTLLYSQLGITDEIMNGTANEETMLNYNNRMIEPVLSPITDEFTRKFLTKTARTQGQVVTYFRDPFRLVPVGQIAEIADKFTRNEIMSSNEIRQIVGMRPSSDPAADELRNKNLSQSKEALRQKSDNTEPSLSKLENQNERSS